MIKKKTVKKAEVITSAEEEPMAITLATMTTKLGIATIELQNNVAEYYKGITRLYMQINEANTSLSNINKVLDEQSTSAINIDGTRKTK